MYANVYVCARMHFMPGTSRIALRSFPMYHEGMGSEGEVDMFTGSQKDLHIFT